MLKRENAQSPIQRTKTELLTDLRLFYTAEGSDDVSEPSDNEDFRTPDSSVTSEYPFPFDCLLTFELTKIKT